MRIAIYWEQESWGGVDSHLLELLSSWPAAEDEFILFYNRGNKGFERIREKLSANNHVRSIETVSWSYNELARRLTDRRAPKALRYMLHVLKPFTFVMMVWRLSRLFSKTGRIDLLLSDNGGYPAAWGCLSALLAAKRAGIHARVLLVHHEATWPTPLMHWFEHLVDSMVTSTANALVCVSYATRQTLIERRRLNTDKLRMRVIHNGMSFVSGAKGDGCAPCHLRRTTDELLVGIVGRVEPYKGHDDVIFALARLSTDARCRLKLIIIGTGDETEIARLRKLATRLGVADCVEFLGYVPGRSTDLIAQLDLLIVATRSFEGFGLTLIEAMGVGTPVLATRVGAVTEFVDGSVGTLVNPGSPQEISIALDDFLANRDSWRLRARHAQDRVRNLSGRMAHEYHRLFIECVAMR